ncbi:hypothetical protein Tco_0663091 [Tanacetum coccineum]
MKDDEQAKRDDLPIWLSLIAGKDKMTFEHGNIYNSESSVIKAMYESNSSGSVSPELLAEVSGKEMTTDDLQRIQNALNVMMRSQYDLENDLEELNSRWVKKTIKRLQSVYTRYVVDHWKSP